MAGQKNKDLNPRDSVTWFVDENLSDKVPWLDESKKVEYASTLNLISTPDATISNVLSDKYEKVIVLTANRREDVTGDYFKEPDSNTGFVLFGPSLAGEKTEVKQTFLKKFLKMFKSSNKLLGTTTIISKTEVIVQKGNKTKTISYQNYI